MCSFGLSLLLATCIITHYVWKGVRNALTVGRDLVAVNAQLTHSSNSQLWRHFGDNMTSLTFMAKPNGLNSMQ